MRNTYSFSEFTTICRKIRLIPRPGRAGGPGGCWEEGYVYRTEETGALRRAPRHSRHKVRRCSRSHGFGRRGWRRLLRRGCRSPPPAHAGMIPAGRCELLLHDRLLEGRCPRGEMTYAAAVPRKRMMHAMEGSRCGIRHGKCKYQIAQIVSGAEAFAKTKTPYDRCSPGCTIHELRGSRHDGRRDGCSSHSAQIVSGGEAVAKNENAARSRLPGVHGLHIEGRLAWQSARRMQIPYCTNRERHRDTREKRKRRTIAAPRRARSAQ